MMKLKIPNLEKFLGAKLKKEHSKFKKSDLYIGMMNAVVETNRGYIRK